MIAAIRYFFGFLLWNVLVGLVVLYPRLIPPLLAVVLAPAFSYWVLFRFVLRRGRPDEPRRWATLRLRPLRDDVLRWTLLAVPVLLLLNWAANDLYFRTVPVPPERLDPLAPYQQILDTPLGQLALALLAVGIAPMLEEFFFRGLIQRTLERRFGWVPGLLGASMLFALVHGVLWFFPLYVLLGLIFGFAVYSTRSIWAGVVLHAANNSAALIGSSFSGEPAPVPTLWEAGLSPDWWVSAATLVVAGAVAAWIARRLWDAGRGARLRYA